jgi:hypothetical protein
MVFIPLTRNPVSLHSGTEIMDLPSRHILIGMTLGAMCASILAVTGPGAVVETFADEMLKPAVVAPGFDTTKLVRFEDRDYEIRAENWVSQDPISSDVVKKVEGGRVSYVTIATTSTGTYSTDGLFSNKVQYPGITVEDVTYRPNNFFYWRSGGWSSFNSRKVNSFLYIRSGDTRVSTWGNRTCVSGKGFRVC